MAVWVELSEEEEDEVWSEFKEKFEFKPSVYQEDWPGIKEPVNSVTYDIACVFDDINRIKLEKDLEQRLKNAFSTIIREGEMIYAMDWQHACYKFNPLQSPIEEWVIPTLPDGEYYIFLTMDLSNGIFGHPWEQTICVFGNQLLNEICKDPPLMLKKIERKGNYP